MFTRLYVEALLADLDQADRVWQLWNAGVITDDLAAWAWAWRFVAVAGQRDGAGVRR